MSLSNTGVPVTFIFGPNNSWFFDTPKMRSWNNLPPSLLEKFKNPKDDDGKIEKVYTLSLSPDGDWFLGWLGATGKSWWQVSDDIKYAKLDKWIKNADIHKSAFISTLRVTLGPGSSFFAYSKYGYRWHGVPDLLDENIQYLLAYEGWRWNPQHVSLGMNESYVMVLKGGGWRWSFHQDYPALQQILDETPGGDIAYCAINPCNRNQHFVLFKDGSAKWNVPSSWASYVQEMATKWAEGDEDEIVSGSTSAGVVKRKPLPYETVEAGARRYETSSSGSTGAGKNVPST